MKVLLALFILAPLVLFAQENSFDFPKDTSYTLWSASQKIKKDFPYAIPVKRNADKNFVEEWDVVYYSLNERDLHADIFYPIKKNEKFSTVILVHGGGWASGNKSHLVPLAQKLAEKGFLTATVEHRLSPEAHFPAAIIDLKTFVKWLKINSTIYHADTTKIAILGCSSGATLASFIATTGLSSKFISHDIQEKVSDKVQALINIDGIVDFTDPNESGKDNNPEKPSAGTRWLGYTYKQNPAIWIEASPLSYVGENTPPTLYINSALPRFHAGRDEFIKVLNQNNIYSEIHTIENTPHTFWLFHPWFDITWPKIIHFLEKVL